MKFSMTLPTYVWPGMDYRMARTVVQEFARRAERHGFDSVTVWDHLQSAPGLYGGSWLDPLLCLSHAAACTERVRIGTDILVLPIRHPVLLAKELATLDSLSGGRFFWGVGPGWNEPEFTSMGISMKERGARTDEVIEAVKRLLTEPNVTFEGRYFKFRNVTIDPRPPKMPEIWVAGGSRIPHPLSPDKPHMVKTVLDRIARHADVFTCRASGNQEYVKNDFGVVREHLASVGRDPKTLRLAQVQAAYLAESGDREEALRRQRPHFEVMMGTERGWAHLKECYLVGTVEDIVRRIKDLEAAGLEYLAVHPAAPEPDQVDLWAEKIMPHFR